ncbi:MMPL family transporter [Myxococcaceae bacterium JPH2]|nr:MMPL family transporter [Myxococcaceae bacterium JPH2]
MVDWIDRLSRRLVTALLERRRQVLLVATVLTLVGTALSIQLYGDLRSEVEELLPSDAPSVVAARVLTPRLYDVNHLSVVLEGNDPQALRRFADALAERLRTLPPTLVRSVEYRVDAERAFFQRFGLFYLPVEDLRTLVARVRARMQWERMHLNPFMVDLIDADAKPPSLDFRDLLGHSGAGLASVDRFRSGYYQSQDGKRLVLLVRPPQVTTGYAFNHTMLEEVRRQVQALHPEHFDPSMRVGYDGEVATMMEEQAALQSDLLTSGVVVLAGVTGVLWLYFRRWRALAAIIGSLMVGCSVTFGLADVLIGHLNANTAFLGSIVVGNGINAAIIYLGRYLEERHAAVPVPEAIRIAWAGTVAPTFVASFAAGLAYLSLAVTRFRGFNQFGVMGGMGMALCWLSAYLVLPPLLYVLESPRPMELAHVVGARPLTSRLARWVVSRRGLIQVVSLVLLATSVAAVTSYQGPLVEADFNKLRARDSQKHGSIYWGHRVDEVFQSYLTPVVIVGDSAEDLQRVVDLLNARQRALGDQAILGEVRTARTLVPMDAEAKLPLMHELRALLPDSRLSMLPPALRHEARMYRPPANARPPRWDEVPLTLREPLTERDGTVGRVAFAYPKRVGSIDARYGLQLTDTIRAAIHDAGGRALSMGRPLLIADITHAILRDGPRATLLALAAVSALVFGVTRHARLALTVLAGLLLGVAWLVGLAALLRLRLNFLNFVVLPITFGIGVDYAANLILRYREEGPGSLSRVIEGTGGAVALCSSTTIIGYASLLMSRNQALANFGLLAAMGEVACLSAALLALPALLLPKQASTPEP